MKFFRGHALIRGGHDGHKYTLSEGGTFIRVGTISGFSFAGGTIFKGGTFFRLQFPRGHDFKFSNRQKKEELSEKLSSFGNTCLNV